MEHHNNRKHAGRSRCLKSVSDLYYWRSITKDIGDWIDGCKDCAHPSNPVVYTQCIVPGCESSGLADNEEGITFHRYDSSYESMKISTCSSIFLGGTYMSVIKIVWFLNRFPFNDAERLNRWIKFCQRDRWSLHSRSAICSRHFDQDCFDRPCDVACLKPDAVPTIEITSVPHEVSGTQCLVLYISGLECNRLYVCKVSLC